MIWNEYDIVDTSKNFFMIPARGTGGSMIYRLGTELPWLCDYGFNMFVDFCIWTLEVDGLQVPPFAHHPSGDGTLRAAGLDAQGWRVWTDEVVTRQYVRPEPSGSHSWRRLISGGGRYK